MFLRNDGWAILAIALFTAPWYVATADEPEPNHPFRVVIAAEAPTWNQRYFAAALQRDATIKSSAIIAQREAKVSNHLEGVSVLILVETSTDLFEQDPDLAKRIAKFVEQGGGLVVLANQMWTDDDTLAELLPVTVVHDDQIEGNDALALSHPTITSTGLRSSILRLVDDPMRNQQLWREELGPSFGPPIPVNVRGEAEILAVDPKRRLGAQPIPLIAVGRHGKGRVVFLNNSQTWRWRKNPLGNFHDRFLLQMTRFAVGIAED